MKYTKPVDVWDLNPSQRKELKIGQWVYAGHPTSKGIWCGQRQNGIDVVAWYNNAKDRTSFSDYVKTLIQYAKG